MAQPTSGRRRSPQARGVSAHRLSAARIRMWIRAQLAEALVSLRARSPSDVQVHAARKSIKRARAGLRLLRDMLGRAAYQRENETLRDAGRPLSPARDAKILLDVLESLAEKHSVNPDSAKSLRKALDRRRSQLERRALAEHQIVAVRRLLREGDRRIRRWSLAAADADAAMLIRALRRVYRRGQKTMADAAQNPHAAALHEWRKEVKYLWHALQILPPKQVRADARADTAHKLADHLGDNHDLAVLHDYVLARRKLLSRAAARALLREIRKRRLVLEKKAFTLGRRLFREKPRKFVARFQRLRPASR